MTGGIDKICNIKPKKSFKRSRPEEKFGQDSKIKLCLDQTVVPPTTTLTFLRPDGFAAGKNIGDDTEESTSCFFLPLHTYVHVPTCQSVLQMHSEMDVKWEASSEKLLSIRCIRILPPPSFHTHIYILFSFPLPKFPKAALSVLLFRFA